MTDEAAFFPSAAWTTDGVRSLCYITTPTPFFILHWTVKLRRRLPAGKSRCYRLFETRSIHIEQTETFESRRFTRTSCLHAAARVCDLAQSAYSLPTAPSLLTADLNLRPSLASRRSVPSFQQSPNHPTLSIMQSLFLALFTALAALQFLPVPASAIALPSLPCNTTGSGATLNNEDCAGAPRAIEKAGVPTR